MADASKESDVRSEGLSSNVIIDETGDDRGGNDDAEIIEGMNLKEIKWENAKEEILLTTEVN